jgi:carbamate kinase
MSLLAVIALGGNALLRDGQSGTIDEQEQNTSDTLENIVFLLRKGYNIVITHGNGPQIGNILMQGDAGEQVYGIPQMPVDICVADSQGGVGYMIERILRNVLKNHHISREVVSLITLTLVDPADPAFQNPTKRVGKRYSKEEAEQLEASKGWKFKQEIKGNGGFRRVVPSPKPIRIMNHRVVETMARQGTIVIAAGGGGIPVFIDEESNVRPAEVVVDKDLASATLATQIKADEFYILTDVPFVYLNYKTDEEKALGVLSIADAQQYLSENKFGEGSMAPKVEAAIQFLANGGKKCIITEAIRLSDKSFGTKIVKSS